MARTVYFPDGDVYRKISKIYAPVGSVYRKIRKGYAPIDGFYKLIYSAEKKKIEYYGRVAFALKKEDGSVLAQGKNYVIQAGGSSVASGDEDKTVAVIDESLTSFAGTDSTFAGLYVATASFDGNAIICGGYGKPIPANADLSRIKNECNRYSDALTRISFNMSERRSGHGAGATQTHFFAVGGHTYVAGTAEDPDREKTADAFDVNFTNTKLTGLTARRVRMPVESAGEYLLIVGGYAPWGTTNTGTKTVDAFDSSLSLVSGVSDADDYYNDATRARAGESAVFYGPYNRLKYAISYDKYLTQHQIEAPSVATYGSSGTTLDGRAVFTGGNGVGGYMVDMYDEDLTKTSTDGATVPNSIPYNGASVGKYAVFANERIVSAYQLV